MPRRTTAATIAVKTPAAANREAMSAHNAAMQTLERERYEADPTGGSASRY